MSDEMIEPKSDSMWKEMVTPKVQNDVADFWNKYREENGIGDNIVLVVMNIERSLTLELGRVMNLFIDAVMSQRMSQREYSGKSALEPKVGDEDEDGKIEIKLEDLLRCPKCGTKFEKSNFHSATDPDFGDEYRWVKCEACGWQEEG